jgi:hypothetical protein
MVQYPGCEILNVVRNDDGGLGDDRRRNDMGILPLRSSLAQPLDGGNKSRRRGNIGDRESLFHFAPPILDFPNRDTPAGIKVPHPLRMDIVGPNRFKSLGFGKTQK